MFGRKSNIFQTITRGRLTASSGINSDKPHKRALKHFNQQLFNCSLGLATTISCICIHDLYGRPRLELQLLHSSVTALIIIKGPINALRRWVLEQVFKWLQLEFVIQTKAAERQRFHFSGMQLEVDCQHSWIVSYRKSMHYIALLLQCVQYPISREDCTTEERKRWRLAGWQLKLKVKLPWEL